MDEFIRSVLEACKNLSQDLGVAAVILELPEQYAMRFDGRLSSHIAVLEGKVQHFSSVSRAMVWAHMENVTAVVMGGSLLRRLS